jgi:hypothetical protein
LAALYVHIRDDAGMRFDVVFVVDVGGGRFACGRVEAVAVVILLQEIL